MNTKPQILMIEQEIQGTDLTPLDIILKTDGERLELLAKEKELKENNGTDLEL